MESKKEIWKLVINVLVAALSAIATALGVTSCMCFDISVTCSDVFLYITLVGHGVEIRRVFYNSRDGRTDGQNILAQTSVGWVPTQTILLTSIKWSIIILLTPIK